MRWCAWCLQRGSFFVSGVSARCQGSFPMFRRTTGPIAPCWNSRKGDTYRISEWNLQWRRSEGVPEAEAESTTYQHRRAPGNRCCGRWRMQTKMELREYLRPITMKVAPSLQFTRLSDRYLGAQACVPGAGRPDGRSGIFAYTALGLMAWRPTQRCRIPAKTGRRRG